MRAALTLVAVVLAGAATADDRRTGYDA